MHRGFAKIYRKFLEWEWYNDVPCKAVYLHCLLMANHKDKKFRGNIVPRGSFLTGRAELAKATGLTEQQVRTAMRKINPEYVTSRSTNSGTQIFVVDFDTYNGDDTNSNQQSNQQSTNEQPTSNQQVTTTKKCKKEKNRKNVALSPQSLQIAEHLFHSILSWNEEFKKPNIESWAEDIDRAIRIDRRDPVKLMNMVNWITKDDFWRPNILSGKKLRQQYDKIRSQAINTVNRAKAAVSSPEAEQSWQKILLKVYGGPGASSEQITEFEKLVLKKTKPISVLKREDEKQLPFSKKAFIAAYLDLAKSAK